MDFKVMAAVVAVLSKHLSLRRLSRFQAVLNGRVRDTVLVFENLGDSHNIAACLRTADALGVQDVHIIERWNDRFSPCSSTSKGSSKWLTLHRHTSVKTCLDVLRHDGFVVCATDLGTGAIAMEQAVAACVQTPCSEVLLDSVVEGVPSLPYIRRRVALCFGNEHRGSSASLRAHSDVRFYIPMLGFVQSLNVSVAVAISTAAFFKSNP